MQRSFGEQVITINSSIVGKVRVLNVYAFPAIYPCLGLTLGVTLTSPKSMQGGLRVPTDFQMRDLRGELRLSEHGDAAGMLQWAGQRQFVRSDSHEGQITLACEVDPFRLSRIEKWRNGEPPRFWIQLWPSVVEPAEWHDAEIVSFAIEVPHKAWLDALEKWGTARWSLLEVPFLPVDEQRFHLASEHLTKALRRLDIGDYDDAVGECRLAIDAMFEDLAQTDKSAFADSLGLLIVERRRVKYSELLSVLKAITHEPHHRGTQFLRAEAVFVTQTTQHLIALVGAVTSAGS